MSTDRLVGWKEIADYLKVSVSTARRYVERGLPVRKIPNGSGSGSKDRIFAIRAEVDEWLASERSGINETALPRGPALAADEQAVLRTQEAEISSQLALIFDNHWRHALLSSGLYALVFAVELLVEVAYEFNRFGSIALRLAPLVFLWILATSLAGLWLDWVATRQGKTNGVILSLIVFIGAGFLLQVVMWWVLPDWPVTQSRLQAHTAQAAYLKTVGYFLALAGVFLVIPFHFVLAMQRELGLKQQQAALRLITSEHWGLGPKGAIYLRTWWLSVLLVAAAALAVVGTAYMFDNLKPGAYMNLFAQLLQLRVLLYFASGVECLIWYHQAINEIKRECLAVVVSTDAVLGPAH